MGRGVDSRVRRLCNDRAFILHRVVRSSRPSACYYDRSKRLFFQGKGGWVASIFMGLWSILAWLSARHVRQRLAVGRVRLELLKSPVQPGETLNGSVMFERSFRRNCDVEVQLQCQRRVSHEGSERTTTVETLWSRREKLHLQMEADGAGGFGLPVSFTLPPDAPESGCADFISTRHEWKLTLTIPALGIKSSFEIPVFFHQVPPTIRVDASPTVASMFEVASGDLQTLLQNRKIRSEFDEAGLPVLLVCPPVRLIGFLVFLTVFNALWTGICFFLMSRQTPVALRVIWCCVGALLWLLWGWNALHKRTVRFHSSNVKVLNELGPVCWARSFKRSEISGFGSEVQMTSNSSTFHRVYLETLSGKKKTLVDGIDESLTAEALTARFGLWLGSNTVSSSS